MNKYEQLIEFIINDDSDKARELFHNIVVEKSRDIYESLIDETDLDETFGGNQVSGLVDEIQVDEEGLSEEEEGAEEFGAEEDSELDNDFDNSGDLDSHEEEHATDEERITDLESALDELKAEFDALMAGEEGEAEHADMFGGEEEGAEEFGADDQQSEFFESEEDDEEDDEEEDLEESIVREYVEKVADQGQKTEGGEVGAGKSATINTKGIVAGKTDMGGSSANIAKGGANQNPDGQSPNRSVKPKGDLIGKVQNTAGGTKSLSSANKPKAGEGQTTDGKVPVATKSPLAR